MFPIMSDGSGLPKFWPHTPIHELIPAWEGERQQVQDPTAAYRLDVCRDGTLSV